MEDGCISWAALVASCSSLIIFSPQNPTQTGEQELESLVLKLSVLKDFLSGIQKKVAGLLTSDPSLPAYFSWP